LGAQAVRTDRSVTARSIKALAIYGFVVMRSCPCFEIVTFSIP
jgi:hypothetical protein